MKSNDRGRARKEMERIRSREEKVQREKEETR